MKNIKFIKKIIDINLLKIREIQKSINKLLINYKLIYNLLS